jgi:hypothetical protein
MRLRVFALGTRAGRSGGIASGGLSETLRVRPDGASEAVALSSMGKRPRHRRLVLDRVLADAGVHRSPDAAADTRTPEPMTGSGMATAAVRDVLGSSALGDRACFGRTAGRCSTRSEPSLPLWRRSRSYCRSRRCVTWPSLPTCQSSWRGCGRWPWTATSWSTPSPACCCVHAAARSRGARGRVVPVLRGLRVGNGLHATTTSGRLALDPIVAFGVSAIPPSHCSKAATCSS